MRYLKYIFIALSVISNLFAWDSVGSYNKNNVVSVICDEITLEESGRIISEIEKITKINKDPILIQLSTTGGHGGLIVGNYLQIIDNVVDIVVVGPCNSGGTLLLGSATGKRYMTSNSIIGLHIPEDTLNTRLSKLYTKLYYEFIGSKFSLEKSNLDTLQNTGLAYFTKKTAITNGIVDEVINDKLKNKNKNGE